MDVKSETSPGPGVSEETPLTDLVLGLANPQLCLLTATLPSEWDTWGTLQGVTAGSPRSGLSPYSAKDRGSERFRNSLGSHSLDTADLGLSHCP